MVEFTDKHERLIRLAVAVAVAIVWSLCAYVTFSASEADDTVLSMADVGLSKAAVAAALYKRLRSATARRDRRDPARGS
jgi:hypothetical protein